MGILILFVKIFGDLLAVFVFTFLADKKVTKNQAPVLVAIPRTNQTSTSP